MSVRGIKNGRKMIIAGLPPVATTTSRGTVKPDGVTITVDGDGTIRSTGGISIDNDTIVKNSQKQLKVSDNIINALNGKADKSTTYTKIEVDDLISGSGGSVAIDNDTITKNSQNEIQVADKIITQINTIEEKVDDIVAPTPTKVNFLDYFSLASDMTLSAESCYIVGKVLYVYAYLYAPIGVGITHIGNIKKDILSKAILNGYASFSGDITPVITTVETSKMINTYSTSNGGSLTLNGIILLQ